MDRAAHEDYAVWGNLINGGKRMKTRAFGICAAMACFMAAWAAMAGDGAETGGGAVSLPEPFGKVQMGMTLEEVRKALPKAKTRLIAARKEYAAGPDGRRDLLMVSVPTPPAKGKDTSLNAEASSNADRPWDYGHLHFADGRLVSASLWGKNAHGNRGGVDASREAATFLSVAALFGAPDKEEFEDDGENEYTSSKHVWNRPGAIVTLGQSFSKASGARAWSSASLFVDCEQNVTPARESPFATPLTEVESAPATGRDTDAALDALLPPDYGLLLGMGRFRACLARPGLLHRDGESNKGESPIVRYSSRLPERKGRGDIVAAFENGRLVWIDVNWSFDDGWTADNPGMIRKVLDDTIGRLGPPTKRWTKETGRRLQDGTFAPPDPVEDTWHVWQWTKEDKDVIVEIRRSSDARRTLRASFSAGALRRLAPDILAFPADSETEKSETKGL